MMTMMDAEHIVTKLRELKPIISARYKAREIGLFGSFVRGEQNANSDIDVLVEFDDGADLFDLIGLTLYLEEILQRHVDVVPKRALRTELQESVLRELIAA
jgi:predicted nucleotidyltransferase